MSDFVEAITTLEAKKAELDSQIKVAEPKSAKDAEGEDFDAAEAAEDDPDPDNAVSEEQLKDWKKERTAVKKQLKAKYDTFNQHIATAVDGLTPEAADDLLLTILHNDMQAIVERYMTAQRKQIVAAFKGHVQAVHAIVGDVHHIADLSEALAQILGELDFVFNEQNFHGVILEECSLFVDYEFVIWLLAPCR